MKEKKAISFYKKRRYLIGFVFLVLLIAFRLYLPTLVKNQINKTLANIPGYYGQVTDIQIDLYRGAYIIKGMYLNKRTAKTEVPFLKFPTNDISIEWKSLFKGKILSEIIMYNPKVVYIFEDQTQKPTDAGYDDWSKALTDIVPIDINHFEVHRGKLAFVQLQASPDIDLEVTNFNMYADNLRNVVNTGKTLPSPFHATGVTFGNGNLTLDGNINLIKRIPDLDLTFSLKSSNAVALNDVTKHYVGVDFEKGKFELYSEVAIADGYLKGYLKPLLTDTKLIGKSDTILEKIWEGFIGFFKFILKNQKTDTLALKIPIEGDLKAVKSNTWKTIFSIFENGWVQAFKRETDDEISFKDTFILANSTDKKELRETRRKIRRENRQLKREE